MKLKVSGDLIEYLCIQMALKDYKCSKGYLAMVCRGAKQPSFKLSMRLSWVTGADPLLWRNSQFEVLQGYLDEKYPPLGAWRQELEDSPYRGMTFTNIRLAAREAKFRETWSE